MVVMVVMAMVTSLPTILNRFSLPKELRASLPDSAKSTISQHNYQYQVNTALQDNT